MNDSNDTQELALKGVEEIIQERKPRKDKLKAKNEEQRVETFHQIWKWNNDKSKEPKIAGLPNEIWAHHFMPQLEDVAGMLNMWEAHPRFRDLSRESPAYVEHLLTQVLRIENLPHLNLWETNFLQLGFGVYKTLRMLSKTLKNAVDEHIEEKFMKKLRGKECVGPRYNKHLRTRLSSAQSLDGLVANFCNEPVDTRAKCAFNRSLKVSVGLDHGVARQDFPKMTLLLEMIGSQLWYFSISFFLDINNLSEDLLVFRRWILLMPNLKWLKIDFGSRPQNKSPFPKNFAVNHPFPHLEHLEKLCLGMSPSTSHGQNLEVIAWVIEANLQIRTLGLGEFSLEQVRESGYSTDLFKSLLAKLDLVRFSAGEIGWMNTIPLIQPLVDTNWNLKYMHVCVWMKSIRPIFDFANHFPNLDYLSIHVLDTSVGDKLPYLELPRLTHFEFTIGFVMWESRRQKAIKYKNNANVRFFFSLQFLIHCKLLKNLGWSYSYFWQRKPQRKLRRFMKKQERSKIIDFRGGLRDLTFSNIWDVFPNLKSVKKRFYHGSKFYENRKHMFLQ